MSSIPFVCLFMHLAFALMLLLIEVKNAKRINWNFYVHTSVIPTDIYELVND